MPKVAIDKPIVAAHQPQQSVYGALLLDGFLSEKLIASAKIQKKYAFVKSLCSVVMMYYRFGLR